MTSLALARGDGTKVGAPMDAALGVHLCNDVTASFLAGTDVYPVSRTLQNIASSFRAKSWFAEVSFEESFGIKYFAKNHGKSVEKNSFYERAPRICCCRAFMTLAGKGTFFLGYYTT